MEIQQKFNYFKYLYLYESLGRYKLINNLMKF